MERDMDLVRDLLFIIEKNDDSRELPIPKEWDREVVAYHLKILDQAGFIENHTKWAGNQPMWIIASLTWDGHEFLDSIKNNTIWSKTIEGIKDKGFELSSVPLEVMKEYAKLQIKSLLGLE
ncbi:DUF2513 domain-containing protein [Fredinandcohnia sp. QZ13]|uniref:DUF2513 domain-containing protein n=1 Tax=Fredinandcohnia sp. QZ13 TaxID=3073144 RepID=UPI00285365B7|nr:DUF2513 domain-containing protein [Fredinandcohnia sp. QZ13]MDR4887895.1 DUF2513 domain-containing protein [Fredinandcohnia sp. QZ13]